MDAHTGQRRYVGLELEGGRQGALADLGLVRRVSRIKLAPVDYVAYGGRDIMVVHPGSDEGAAVVAGPGRQPLQQIVNFMLG
jgi:hypothetical protein